MNLRDLWRESDFFQRFLRGPKAPTPNPSGSGWAAKEIGPVCSCGQTTWVQRQDDGRAILLCLWHDRAAGAMCSLPRERPSHWPNLTDDEMRALIKRGEAEDAATSSE